MQITTERDKNRERSERKRRYDDSPDFRSRDGKRFRRSEDRDDERRKEQRCRDDKKDEEDPKQKPR